MIQSQAGRGHVEEPCRVHPAAFSGTEERKFWNGRTEERNRAERAEGSPHAPGRALTLALPLAARAPNRAPHALRHVEPYERLGDRRAAAPRVRHPLAHQSQPSGTVAGSTAAALVKPHACVQQHSEGPPCRDVPPPRRRERRSRVDHRLRTARTAPLPRPVVGLLERDPAGEADVRGFPMAHRLSLKSAPGDSHRLVRLPHRRDPRPVRPATGPTDAPRQRPRPREPTRAEAILAVAVRLASEPAPGRNGPVGPAFPDASEGSRS